MSPVTSQVSKRLKPVYVFKKMCFFMSLFVPLCFPYHQRSPARQTLSQCGNSQWLWWHCILFLLLCSRSTFGGWDSFLASQDSGWRPTSHIAHRVQGIELRQWDNYKKRRLYKINRLSKQDLFWHLDADLSSHLDMLEVVHPSVVSLLSGRLEFHCQPMKIQGGIYSEWCHLDIENHYVGEDF